MNAPAIIDALSLNSRNGLDFLRDNRGVYGLGFRMPLMQHGCPRSIEIIVRPDMLEPQGFGTRSSIALQPVPLRPQIFKYVIERDLANSLHRILFEQSSRLDGFDPGDGPGTADLKDERLRKKFYGCQAKAYRITNFLIGKLLVEAADARALRQARRFRLIGRGPIYFLATRSERLSQVCETFPFLAALVAAEIQESRAKPLLPYRPVVEAIEAGKSLRHVAGMAGVPYVMRAIPPLAATRAHKFCDMFRRNPHLIKRMPKGGRAASAWFEVLGRANDVSPDFAEWCAKKIEVRPPYEESTIDVSNIGDWVRTSYEKHVQAAIDDLARKLQDEVPAEYVRQRLDGPFQSRDGVDLVTRTFRPDMSARTVHQLSEAWHDAVADQQFSGDVVPFPKAWAPAREISGYQIIPLETPLALYHEAKGMHNCVMTYGGSIRHGSCYLFSLQKDERRIATIEIGVGSEGFHLAQFSGPCNQRVAKPIERIIQKWARTTKFEREETPARAALPNGMDWCQANENGGNLDDDIPF